MAGKRREENWKRRVRYQIKINIEKALKRPKHSKQKLRNKIEDSIGVQRRIVLLLKQKPCADCGKFYPPCCMDFDHVRGKKVDNVSKLAARRVPVQEILDEVAKCELVCAICHRIRTAKRNNERPEVYSYPEHVKDEGRHAK